MDAPTITVRYFAAARAAAATRQEPVALADGARRADLVAALTALHPTPPPGEPALARVLEQSALLADGVALLEDAPVPVGATVDVLPPFSGG